MATLVAALAIAKPVAISIDSFVSQATSLVHQQHRQPADTVRSLDRRLDALSAQAVKLGYEAAPAFFNAAADPRQPLKLRIWMVSYLHALHDAAAFVPLKRLLLEPAHPDLVREAAARGLASCPVSSQAKRLALCAALDANLGPAALGETLFELRSLGCDDPAALERSAKLFGARPQAREAALAGHAAAALGSSRALSALESLDRLFDHFDPGSPARAEILAALTGRAFDLKLDGRRWLVRGTAMLLEEARHPEGAERGIRLLAALGDVRAAAALQRFLRNQDGKVVVAAAEALAAVGARQALPALDELYARFPIDPRFAPAPDRDAVALYERLGAALKRLK